MKIYRKQFESVSVGLREVLDARGFFTSGQLDEMLSFLTTHVLTQPAEQKGPAEERWHRLTFETDFTIKYRSPTFFFHARCGKEGKGADFDVWGADAYPLDTKGWIIEEENHES